MRTLVFGANSDQLSDEVEKRPELELVDSAPDVVISYGGDGTLLKTELQWPGIPKVPIRNSLRGNRCIPHAWREVIGRLAKGQLCANEYVKLECAVTHSGQSEPTCYLTAINEFNVHNAHINTAIRFKVWIDEEPYLREMEIVGDGLVICTPFGSTAYFNQITHGVFFTGLGIAFKYTGEHTNHMVLPEETAIRVGVIRGPAMLAFDNAVEYFELNEGDEIRVRKHDHPAVLYTWDQLRYPTDSF